VSFQPQRSVLIGGHRVKIKVVENFEDWGEYDHDEKTISVSSRAMKSKAFYLSTLRHEMVHAALAIGGVAFSESMEEEAIVRCMDELFFPAWDRVAKRYRK